MSLVTNALSTLVKNMSNLMSRDEPVNNKVVDFRALPTELQLLVFQKLDSFETFKTFDQASRATNRLGKIDKKTKFSEDVHGHLNIKDGDHVPNKAHCRPHFSMISIHNDEEKVVQKLMISETTSNCLIFHNMRMEPEMFEDCLQKMKVKQVILWDCQSNVLTSSNLDKLDHLFFNSLITDEMLLSMSPRLPQYVSISGSIITDLGLEQFCQQIVRGERDIDHVTISTGYTFRGFELAQRLGAQYFLILKDGNVHTEVKVLLVDGAILTIAIYQHRVAIFKEKLSVFPDCIVF